MYVCMYIYMYTYTYICIYTYIYTLTHINIHTAKLAVENLQVHPSNDLASKYCHKSDLEYHTVANLKSETFVHSHTVHSLRILYIE